jgi:isochorismate synthase
VLVSVSDTLPALDPLNAFAAAAGERRGYWEHDQPDGSIQRRLAGIGAAHIIRASGSRRFASAAQAWRDLLDQALIDAPAGAWATGPLLMGGFSFDPLRAHNAEWSAFPDCMLMLPRATVLSGDEGCRLTMNCVVTAESDVEREADALHALYERIARSSTAEQEQTPARVQATLREALPGARWQAKVAETAREIRAGRYAKVVLARQAELDLPATPQAQTARALRRLRAAFPGSFRFAFAVPERRAEADAVPRETIFLGATPERLVRLEGGAVEATVLAGSARRGATAEEDHLLGQELLESAKDRHEHAVVAMMLRVSLAAFCRTLDSPEAPTLMRLRNVQHLYTPVHGHLDGPRSILELLARLHPTPAVGGFPRQAALRVIREREELDRGWYAAPVGWIDRHGQGEFAVAIRSALVHTREDTGGSEARLFAGCGIMGDSDPEREYVESTVKMQAMLHALTE